MQLHIGQRLPGSDAAGYVVTALVGETADSRLYAARKIYANFDFARKQPRETEDKEWLEVLVRTINYPRPSDSADVAARRARLRTEGRRVLTHRHSNIWPEPLDLLEVANTRDGIPGDEPILVLARPHGLPLGDWLGQAPPLEARLTLLAELLDFIESAHEDGLILGGIDPAALLVDRAGRLHYLGSDRALVAPDHAVSGRRREEYNRGADVSSWAALAHFVLTEHQVRDTSFDLLEKQLRAIPPAVVQNWAEELGVPEAALLQSWPDNLVHTVRRCLAPERGQRPAEVRELRSLLQTPPEVRDRAAGDEELLAELWNRVFDEGDTHAHQLLLVLLNPHAYGQALETETIRRATLDDVQIGRLVACLRQAVTVRPLLARLLDSANANVRRLGHEFFRDQHGR